MGTSSKWDDDEYINAVAVIGMAGQFRETRDVDQLWDNLLRGFEAARPLSGEELRESRCPEHILKHPHFVPVSAQMDDVDCFDAGFFGYTPAEARNMDPQLRLMLEAAWHAFEDAGYIPGQKNDLTGVFCGSQFSLYWPCNVRPDFYANQSINFLEPALVNGQDFLSTWISYKLGLRGPSLNIQTACSTGLVLVATACQNLLDHSCDLALAVAGSIGSPRNWGYLAEPESILSPSGHCRPFDASASGTLSGEGVGAVLLKRLADAIEDGDNITAVIRGYAINNDGNARPGYSSPSITGQEAVIRAAQRAACVRSSQIQYVETHGTGTILGDPIEFAALQKVFGEEKRSSPCVIGSVKANYGHLGAAAGILALQKVFLSMRHEQFTPQINFKAPNPEIQLDKSSFEILSAAKPWGCGESRIAAISSFGFGGTNCHMIVEQYPGQKSAAAIAGSQTGQNASGHTPDEMSCIYISAHSESSLKRLCRDWGKMLSANPGLPLGEISRQSLLNRKAFPWRTGAWGKNCEETAKKLLDSSLPSASPVSKGYKNLIAVFSGQGAQYPGMAAGLYAAAPEFREALERCRLLTRNFLQNDILGTALTGDMPQEVLNQTAHAQPLLFSVGYSLYCFLQARGVQPAVVMGHSLGEYTAACVAGVFSLEDALRLVCARGRLMAALPAGKMIAVQADSDKLARMLEKWRPATNTADSQAKGQAQNEADHNPDNLTTPVISACNSPEQTVLSGPPELIDAFKKQLAAQELRYTELSVSHAFHSPLMKPMLEDFAGELRQVTFNTPAIPIISNVTGKLETAILSTPEYWLKHTLSPVLFSQGLIAAAHEKENIFLEIGPRPVLAAPALQTFSALDKDKSCRWLPLLNFTGVRAPGVPPANGGLTGKQAEAEAAMQGLLNLFQAGITPRPSQPASRQSAKKIRLPLLPFDKTRYWLALPDSAGANGAVAADASMPNSENPASHSGADSAGQDEMTLSQAISTIWISVLGIDALAADDDFFALGGTSIAAIRILTAIKSMTGVSVSLMELSQLRTPKNLEAHLEAQLRV